MGSSHSKRSNRSRNSVNDDEDDIKSDEKNSKKFVDREAKLDKQYIDDIKKDLYENPEMFVLNNLLMAMMFFENYPRLV